MLLVVCLVVATVTAGCGGSSIAGVYRLYNPPWKSTPGYALVPHLRLELKSDGTYVQTTYDQTVPLIKTPTGSISKFVEKTYKGTYTVRNNGKGQPKQVILNGEPTPSNIYQIVKLGLSNSLGLWAKKPPPGTQ